MSSNKVSDKVLSIVKKYLHEVERGNVKIQEAYIFGSQALGTQGEDSDIDVCIVSSNFNNTFEDGVMLSKIASKNFDTINIEPHPMTTEDFQSPFSHLAYTIKHTGVKVSF